MLLYRKWSKYSLICDGVCTATKNGQTTIIRKALTQPLLWTAFFAAILSSTVSIRLNQVCVLWTLLKAIYKGKLYQSQAYTMDPRRYISITRTTNVMWFDIAIRPTYEQPYTPASCSRILWRLNRRLIMTYLQRSS